MKKLKTTIFCGIIIAVIFIGISPAFIPPYITEGTYINWKGRDLAEGITGDGAHFNETYPRFSNAGKLKAYDLRGRPYGVQLLLNTLQGLVNRDNASLYLINRDSDSHWLQHLNETSGINYTLLNPPSYWDIIDLYNSSIKGLIIYDENFRDTVNVATFLAGVYNSVVIQASMLPNFATWGLDASNVTFDFRDQFNSKVELYTWAYDNFNQNMSKTGLASISPGQTHFRDYIVALKIFTFWLTPGPFGPPEEVSLFKWILDQFPMNIPLWGWFDEGGLGEYEAIKIMSKAGKYSLNSLPDLTVFSAIQVTSLKQNLTPFDPSNYTIENKVYVSVVVSDGDNSNYCMSTLINYWQDPNRGTIPIGLTYQPLLYRICPTSLKYYYDTATENEYFMAGPSGAGYCYPDMNPAFPAFLNHTKYALEQADMQHVWLLNGYEAYPVDFSREVLNAYASDECNFSALYINYHDFPAEVNGLVNDVPVFHSIFLERENELVGKLQSLKIANPNKPVFAFVGFWAWDFTFTKVKNAADQLGEDFIFLRPDIFAELYKQSQLTSELRGEAERDVFIWAALIPFLGVMLGLIYIWGFYKREDKNPERLGAKLKVFTSKAMFLVIDFVMIMVTRYCFFSTFLNLANAVFMLGALILGIFLKNYLDRLIGVRNNLIFALGTLSVGIGLFVISPKLAMFVGFSVGMLLAHQIQSNTSFFQEQTTKNREFLYSILIAAVLIMLVPTEYYSQLVFITMLLVIAISALSIFYLMRDRENQQHAFSLQPSIKFLFPNGFLLGFLFLFLLAPTLFPEKLFLHLFWGYFPTQLALSFNLAALYLGAILLTEFLNLKGIQAKNKTVLLLGMAAVLSYFLMPVLLSGIFFFILCNFLFIFGMLTCCVYVFNQSQIVSSRILKTFLNIKLSSSRNFLLQVSIIILIGLFLNFIYPAIFVVDSLELFAGFGMTGMSQLPWPSFAWVVFYIPPIYEFLVYPVIIIVLIVGVFSLFF